MNFNTDRGSLFTSDAFVTVLESLKIQISIHGKYRVWNNIWVKRFRRRLKYKYIYLSDYQIIVEL